MILILLYAIIPLLPSTHANYIQHYPHALISHVIPTRTILGYSYGGGPATGGAYSSIQHTQNTQRYIRPPSGTVEHQSRPNVSNNLICQAGRSQNEQQHDDHQRRNEHVPDHRSGGSGTRHVEEKQREVYVERQSSQRGHQREEHHNANNYYRYDH